MGLCFWRIMLIALIVVWRGTHCQWKLFPGQGILDGLRVEKTRWASGWTHWLFLLSDWRWCNQLFLVLQTVASPPWWYLQLWAKINSCFHKLLLLSYFITVIREETKKASELIFSRGKISNVPCQGLMIFIELWSVIGHRLGNLGHAWGVMDITPCWPHSHLQKPADCVSHNKQHNDLCCP